MFGGRLACAAAAETEHPAVRDYDPGVTPTPKPPVRPDRRRVQRNSVPLAVHVLIEYGVGVLTIVSPFLFSFDDDAAKIVAVLIGAGILVLAVVTDAPTGIARTLPAASHVVLDYVIGLLLIVVAVRVRVRGRRQCRDRVLHRARRRLRGARGAHALPRRAGAGLTRLDERVRRGLEAQMRELRRRTAGGERRVGWKVALNDPRVQRALDIAAPVIGFLATGTQVRSGGRALARRGDDARASSPRSRCTWGPTARSRRSGPRSR